MTDFTMPSKHKQVNDNHQNYFSQMLELEYCPTNQLALELMVEGFAEPGTNINKFTGARYEARYRLSKDQTPLNPTLYVEYEDLDAATRYKMETSGWIDPPYAAAAGEEPARESILESRLILSHDFQPWNVAFNWINESDLHAGTTAFGYSLGLLRFLGTAGQGSSLSDNSLQHHQHHAGMVDEKKTDLRSNFLRLASLSIDLFGALGDSIQMGLQPSRQEHYLQPSLKFDIGNNWMLTTGVAIGLTEASDNLFRFNWGAML